MQPDDEESPEEPGWKEQLLEQLMSIAPDAFERLARRLLREADFDSVNVTGRSGDGGIDGLGVYRLGLVSFPVFFQCKRYRGSVSPSAVRDFRGAMAGRGDKGLLITTGTFTADAKKEATRDGAPPIDLIDGDRLCDLLQKYDLGVHTTTRTVAGPVTIDSTFFADGADPRQPGQPLPLGRPGHDLSRQTSRFCTLRSRLSRPFVIYFNRRTRLPAS